MSSQNAFAPSGYTTVITAAAIAPLGVQAQSASGQYRIVNAGGATVFLGVGPTAATARTSTLEPIAGSPAPGIVLVPGAVEVFSFGEYAYFSGLAAVSSTVYITPGAGE